LKQTVRDFLEEKNELSEETTPSYGNNQLYLIWHVWLMLLTISISWIWNCSARTNCFW